jgi:hypothetical protein
LNIQDGGRVEVRGTLTIDQNNKDDCFINLSSGGILAVYGRANDSLETFLSLIEGSDAIQYWDNTANDWKSIQCATPNINYTLEYMAGYTCLTVGTLPTFVPGDANNDGRVDGSDVTILANHWQSGVDDGKIATWAMGDFNRDGRIDGSDVTILANHWQSGVTNAAATVPEPSALVLLTTTILAVGFLSTKKRNTKPRR